ncbi:allophanate hydrolase subunit 1 [Tropicibacter sp. Alg240-R139]|uniref:5-oxoprolinase subunit B family protein n=1 Tax=Tropicibacter sp. Alg240-R139 TaxID=2305991 RepID=UPI0013E01524|nr:carboxyltransferase domain-containing protein [Tropicibacter sp. Alg240-R139]
MTHADPFPLVRNVGLDGMLVTFADTMTETSNRAALAFRGMMEAERPTGVIETSTSLASAYVRFDPLQLSHIDCEAWLHQLLIDRDWFAARLPQGRKFWRVPTVYGTDLAPQLEDAAAAAGLSALDAVERLAVSRVRVLTIGFAPGQPYLGPLEPGFDIPRLKELNPMVPEGALVLAISQFVLFSGPTPTGWRHVGQTAFRCFQPGRTPTFALNPGDEMLFVSITPDELIEIRARNEDGFGGAQVEEIEA